MKSFSIILFALATGAAAHPLHSSSLFSRQTVTCAVNTDCPATQFCAGETCETFTDCRGTVGSCPGGTCSPSDKLAEGDPQNPTRQYQCNFPEAPSSSAASSSAASSAAASSVVSSAAASSSASAESSASSSASASASESASVSLSASSAPSASASASASAASSASAAPSASASSGPTPSPEPSQPQPSTQPEPEHPTEGSTPAPPSDDSNDGSAWRDEYRDQQNALKN